MPFLYNRLGVNREFPILLRYVCNNSTGHVYIIRMRIRRWNWDMELGWKYRMELSRSRMELGYQGVR